MYLTALPSLILFTTNWKIQLGICIPLLFAANAFMIKKAFSLEHDNMIGYKDPEEIASIFMGRFIIYTLVILFAIHNKRHTEVTHFIAIEQAKNQQSCLQNVFDKQPDGVIILSKRLKPKK